jgi:hypothetical protein
MLFDFLEKNVMADVRAERERHVRGVATWKMLWVFLKPGTDVARLTLEGASAAAKFGLFERTGALIECESYLFSSADGSPNVLLTSFSLPY